MSEDERPEMDGPVPGRCGARVGPGRWCLRYPTPNMKRCNLHGGIQPVGPASPNWKHGRYSKFLPKGTAKRYRMALDDPELLSCESEAALLTARLSEVLEGLDSRTSADLWGEIKQIAVNLSGRFGEAEAALRSGNEVLFAESLGAFGGLVQSLGDLAERGGKIGAVWEEARGLIQEKVKVSRAEWARMVDLQAVITAEQAMSLVHAIMHAVVRNCPDPRAREAIAAEVAGFVSDASRGRRASEGEDGPPGG